ncbi:transporter substrate-binding domain-containing protein [Helicovermis profundi]|uniref:histidine kinase n=1 Tax=Helicovermis profundi TaxID=3065157 RepID=A0AAU9E2D1_9FIRM|nr:transporter substrate-binding domain-containing protein [Clostridia bacterium S502]
MKKPSVYIIILFLLIIFINGNFFAFSYDNLSENKDITVYIAGDNNYPPYEFLDEKNEFKGFNVDILKAIAKKEGFKIKFMPRPWKAAIDLLEFGEVDLIQGMTKSEERSKKFDFSDRLISNEQVIFVNKDTTYISSLDDLKGRKISYQKGDISYEILKGKEGIELVEFENQKEAIDALLNKKVSAFIGNKLTGIYNLQKQGNIELVKIVGSPIFSIDYSSAVKKGNTELLSVINKGIKAIKSDGTYDKIYKKWFGETFVNNSKYLEKIFAVLLIILILVVLIGLIVAIINKKLKNEVEKRTKEIKEKQFEIEKNYRQSINIFEGVPSGIIAFNNDNEIVLFNNCAVKLLDIKLMKGMKLTELNLNEKFNINITDSDEKIRNSVSFSRENKKYYIDYSFSRVVGPHKKEGSILLLHDYTEEKFLQDAISHDDKINSLGRLIAGITHEIKSPLNSMKSYLDILPSRYDSIEYIKNLEKVFNEEILRLDQMVTNILDFARYDSTKMDSFNIHQIIEEAVVLFKLNVITRNIKIENITNEFYIYANIQQFKQMVINIIQNAIDASASGDLIIIRSFKKLSKIIIEIEDEGEGISEDMIENLYDPFLSTKSNGNGLGLFITKKLVELNNGNIEFDSDLDDGTTVRLIFENEQTNI